MESENRHQANDINLQLLQSVVYAYGIVSKSKIRKYSPAKIYKLDWLAKILGIKLGLIISGTEHHSAWNVFARWDLSLPLRLGHVFTGHLIIRNSWPTLPRLGLRFQNLIPSDSDMVKACKAGDITRVRDLLDVKTVHPNDKTPDNMTVFRVRSQNFRSPHSKKRLIVLFSMQYIQAILPLYSCSWITAPIQTYLTGISSRLYIPGMSTNDVNWL